MNFFQNYGLEPNVLFHQLHLVGESFPSHFHRAYEILFLSKGELTLIVDSHSYHLEKGDGAFIFSNQIHSFQGTPQTQLEVLIVSPELILDFHQEFQQQLPVKNHLPHLENSFLIKPNMTYYEIKGCLYNICAQLVKRTQFKPATLTEDGELLQKMLRFVMTHYHQKATLQTLAEKLNYDYKYLSKLFIKGTGMGYNDYLNSLRIMKSQDLLVNTQLTISEIAQRCGYTSLKTYHRNYQKIYGKTPGKGRLKKT